MANTLLFTDEEMAIEDLGYPKAYAKLCRDRSFRPFSLGPPFNFTPYAPDQQEVSRAKELDDMFPIIDPEARPTTKPKTFLSVMWKQLSHLGNAGFDPETIRVDAYGNVLYYHADAASPLAWNIDHWFPCSRGGLTVLSNLRILQWQVCKRKHNKLEFLIPWWDLQLGVSVNQFLFIFASSNSDFRHRAFSWLFSEGESEELNGSQTVDSHRFPQHFLESKEKFGLAPAAVVLSRRESSDAPLKSLDLNRRPRLSTPIVAVKKTKHDPKENENPMMVTNPYQAIVLARDSLKQRDETAKMQAEIQKLDNEVSELQGKVEEEKLSIQEMELVLIKKKRRSEKYRRLAESQSSYRAMLEKMIRDAMHQSVVYKEQVRLNQAAASALLARLEAQREICDSAERDLLIKYKQRNELEKQIRPEWNQVRKRSRIDDTLNAKDDEDALGYRHEEIEKDKASITDKKSVLYLPGVKSFVAPPHRELRKLLKEEQRASGARLLQFKEAAQEGDEDLCVIEERLEKLEIQDGDQIYNLKFPLHHEPKEDEDENEESRRERGKGNIEKWMEFLLENTIEEAELKPQSNDENEATMTDELIKKLNLIYPNKEIKVSSDQQSQFAWNINNRKEEQGMVILNKNENQYNKKNSVVEPISNNIITPFFQKNPPYSVVSEKIRADELVSMRRIGSPDESARKGKIGKGRELGRSESGRAFRSTPSSPSLILEGMKKRVDCMGRKPLVLDDNDEEYEARNSFIKSSIKSIKKAVRI